MKLLHLTSIVCLTSFVAAASADTAARVDAIVDACVADDGVSDDDDYEGGWTVLDDVDQEELEPGDIVIDGTVLYAVEVYGYGLCPQFGYDRAVRKAVAACKAAGGELKLLKPVIHAYDISAYGWCYRPNK
jgi:hypothetical protein